MEPRLTRFEDRVELSGTFQMASAASVWRTLSALVSGDVKVPRLDIDVSRVTAIDGAVMALLVEWRAELASRGIVSEIVGASDLVRPLVHVYEGDRPPRPDASPRCMRSTTRFTWSSASPRRRNFRRRFSSCSVRC